MWRHLDCCSSANCAILLSNCSTFFFKWSAVFSSELAAMETMSSAAAVRRRDPKVRRDGRFILALALPVILGTWMPVLLLVPAALAVLRARRVGMQAITARRRFELDDIRDDHG